MFVGQSHITVGFSLERLLSRPGFAIRINGRSVDLNKRLGKLLDNLFGDLISHEFGIDLRNERRLGARYGDLVDLVATDDVFILIVIVIVVVEHEFDVDLCHRGTVGRCQPGRRQEIHLGRFAAIGQGAFEQLVVARTGMDQSIELLDGGVGVIRQCPGCCVGVVAGQRQRLDHLLDDLVEGSTRLVEHGQQPFPPRPRRLQLLARPVTALREVADHPLSHELGFLDHGTCDRSRPLDLGFGIGPCGVQPFRNVLLGGRTYDLGLLADRSRRGLCGIANPIRVLGGLGLTARPSLLGLAPDRLGIHLGFGSDLGGFSPRVRQIRLGLFEHLLGVLVGQLRLSFDVASPVLDVLVDFGPLRLAFLNGARAQRLDLGHDVLTKLLRFSFGSGPQLLGLAGQFACTLLCLTNEAPCVLLGFRADLGRSFASSVDDAHGFLTEGTADRRRVERLKVERLAPSEFDLGFQRRFNAAKPPDLVGEASDMNPHLGRVIPLARP